MDNDTKATYKRKLLVFSIVRSVKTLTPQLPVLMSYQVPNASQNQSPETGGQ